jgi:hypothetical protein
MGHVQLHRQCLLTSDYTTTYTSYNHGHFSVSTRTYSAFSQWQQNTCDMYDKQSMNNVTSMSGWIFNGDWGALTNTIHNVHDAAQNTLWSTEVINLMGGSPWIRAEYCALKRLSAVDDEWLIMRRSTYPSACREMLWMSPWTWCERIYWISAVPQIVRWST